MAKEKDRAAKNFFSDPKIFSEFVNLSLFNGEERIKAEDLREIDPVNSTVFTKNKSLEVLVDNLYDSTVKESDENVYAIIGLESQAYSDKHMVIRAGIASLLIYDNQIANIEEGEKLKPVYIIVFNMLDRKWSNATDLRKLLSDEAIKVFGYPLVNAGYYVLDPHELKGEKINKISKPLKLVLNIIKTKMSSAVKEWCYSIRDGEWKLVVVQPGFEMEYLMISTSLKKIQPRHHVLLNLIVQGGNLV